jgi:CHASE2 domain-containing sensor protein
MPTDSRSRARDDRGRLARPFFLSAVFAILLTLLFAYLVPIYAPGLLRFEHMLGDARTLHLSDRMETQHPHVAVVGISDRTLQDNKVRLPVDRLLLARLVEALDAAGAKVIGLDILFVRTAPADNEERLIDAIKRAKARIVLAAADERLGLSDAEIERQRQFIAATGRPAGHVILATERDWVVRFKARMIPTAAYPKSFASVLVENAGFTPAETHRRIAWLREPRDGSDTFLNVPAETLLGPADDPAVKFARQGLKDKIVLIGGIFPDVDQHVTPLARMPGVFIHSHIAAELLDGRRIVQLEGGSLAMHLTLAGVAFFAFLVGWYYRFKHSGLLASSVATVVIIAVDTIVFWQWRIILPVVLALVAWFAGELCGRYLGRWLGRPPEQARWFGK